MFAPALTDSGDDSSVTVVWVEAGIRIPSASWSQLRSPVHALWQPALTATAPLWRTSPVHTKETGPVMGIERGHLERCMQQPALAAGDTAEEISPSVSLEAEVPELLFEGMRAFIASNPRWDQYSLITSALACFLFQNGCTDPCVTQHYLDSLFSPN